MKAHCFLVWIQVKYVNMNLLRLLRLENTKLQLKVKLKELDFDNPEQIKFKDVDHLIKEMLEQIGSIDSELRDNLIYTTFVNLIQRDYLNPNQMEYIIKTCLDMNHLFFNIGQADDDSVFTRSFSSLVIALILEKDRQDNFLSKDIILNAIESSIIYLQKEEDTRGYVEVKGWAHSIAHGADLLVESIKHPLFDVNLANECLETIGICLLKEASYVDDEEERLIFAIEALLDKGIDEVVIEKWILNLSSALSVILNQDGFALPFFRKKTNLCNFMKALYFRLMYKKVGSTTRKSMEEILEKWHRKLYS